MGRQVGKFRPYLGDDAVALGDLTLARELRTRRAAGGITGAELVRARIALEVRLGMLGTGDRLPDAGVISGALAVSEITVRRALEVMCQDGLLERRRGRAGGTFVAADWERVAALQHDPVLARDHLERAVVLEAGLVSLSGPVDPAHLEVAEDLCAQMERARDDEFAVLETRFHLVLAEVLGGPDNRERLADLLGRLCLLAPSPVADGALNEAHETLLRGLAHGDLLLAIEALKAHDAILRERLNAGGQDRGGRRGRTGRAGA